VSPDLFATPRPVPSRKVPLIGGAVLFALALPLYMFTSLGATAWAVAAGVWLGSETLALVLTRAPLGLSNLASSGAVGVGLIFRQLGAMVVLFVVATHDKHVALAAAGLYAVAYTLELALSMVVYFGQEKQPS
jgi:hypothetical protein